MNKSVIGITIAIVAVLGLGTIVLSANKSNGSRPVISQQTTNQNKSMSESKADQSSPMDLTNQNEVSMDISDFAFQMKDITIKKQTKVSWTNRDSAKHNVVVEKGDKATGPSGPLLAKGESYSFVFNTIGQYNYLCEPHPYMKAIVKVVE